MTPKEFSEQIERLSNCFPSAFPEERIKVIFRHIHDLDLSWWRQTVDRIIITNNPRLDIEEAVRAYRNARGSMKRANNVVAFHESIREQISDEGLSRALKLFGSNNLLDAISVAGRKKP